MTTLRKALVAALYKSFLRGRSLFRALLAFWISGSTSVPASKARARTNSASAQSTSSESSESQRPIQDFLKEAEELFLGPLDGDGLLTMATGLKAQFYEGLQTRMECMLPSFNHLLPTGREKGQFLALDVGGSTLRVALVELRPATAADGGESKTEIVRMMNFKINQEIKNLEGMAFFNWMADRIVETISKGLKQNCSPSRTMPLSLAWSFPVEQTSLKSGRIQGMGKGFLAANGLLGQDLGEVIKLACRSKNLSVELYAILNDSSATLLSQAYSHPAATRMGLILGTGVNIAAYLPVTNIARAKFGDRPQDEWFGEKEAARHVIVNTELGMFGHGDVLPVTRWDRALRAGHPRPDFQPLEHLVSGFYLGEVMRFALIEAIETTGLLGGVVPPSLRTAYALDTETLSTIESDTSSDLEAARKVFITRHPSSVDPTAADMAAFRMLASMISRRSSAIVASCVYGLWDLRLESEVALSKSLTSSPARAIALAEAVLPRTVVAYNGSVIEHYPAYRRNCQEYINTLVAARSTSPGSIDLVAAKESSVIGAAVGLAACIDDGR